MVHTLLFALYLYYINIGISSFPGAGDVWFSLSGTPYQNNSIVTLEDIGDGHDALLCITNLTACCQPPYSGGSSGNWFFPNGTRVPSLFSQWDMYRTRGQMVVALHHSLYRRRGGVEGIYRCEIPDTFGSIQTIYIGVYSASAGEWYMYTPAIKLLATYATIETGNSQGFYPTWLMTPATILVSMFITSLV